MKNAALILFLGFGLISCDGRRSDGPGTAGPSTGLGSVTVKGKKIDVTLVLSEKDRRHAVAQMAPPTETTGHLLLWPRERFMKIESDRSRVPFDVAFLDKSGIVVDLLPLAAISEEGVQPKAPAAAALFLLPGQAGKIGLKPGDKVEYSAEVSSARPEELPVVKINGVSAWVELALTEAERQHGLMFRPHLSPEDGMLFAYTEDGNHSFWMMNTMIPLDIAFIADDGTLVNVNETPMYADPRRPGDNYATSNSKAPARYVLEMNLGWFRKKGLVDGSGHIAPGTKVEIPAWASKGSVD
jgi:uncharacterized membrane protein (UPF0127 family)